MRRRRFKIGVRKEYFPRAMWPTEFGRSYVETFEVLAFTRSEAARLVWEANGERLLGMMIPAASLLGRIISLEVNSPGRVGSIGRLHPVRVHVQEGRKREEKA